ncbi:MAG: amino acid ABC transporter permease [Chloroflexi bacterium]|nr:amino acid ABC transporter permease [Chloroflexota bacterium]
MSAEIERTIPLSRMMAARRRVSGFDWWWLLVIGVAATIVYLVRKSPDPYLRIVLFVRDGMGVTIRLTLISFVLILLVGMIGGLGRISRIPIIKGLASLYVEIIRGIPLLVQLIFIYYAFPAFVIKVGQRLLAFGPRSTTLGANVVQFITSLGTKMVQFKLDPFGAAVLGLTVCYGAYMSEIYRAGIESIPKAQMEAARSLGMNYLQAMRYVILPQAVRMILPPVGNEFISLLKDSSLVSTVAVADMVRRGREFMGKFFLPLETWLMIALLYLVMTLFFTRIAQYIERKMSYEH